LGIKSLFIERERERKRKMGGVVVRDTTMVGKKLFSVLKVPRQCPLDFLVGVRLVFSINSKL
jgi:hypothetical protein